MWRKTEIALCLLAAAALLLAGYGGWLAPSRHGALPALMALAYPIVVVLSMLLALLWLVRRRWVLAVTLLASLLATWPSLRANFPIGAATAATDSTRMFRVMTYNVAAFDDHRWTDTTELHPAMQLILDQDADFVVMQQPNTRGRGALEMKSLARWAQQVTSQYPYYSFSRHDGVEILSKYPFNAQPIGELQQSYRYFPYIVSWYQYYAFDIAMPNQEPLRIIGCYMTSFQLSQGERQVLELNGNRQWRTTQLYEKMHEAFVAREHAAQLVRDTINASCPNVIVCMDLNDVPQSYAYRTIMGHDMRDSYRRSSLPQATFNDHNMLFHIDHILYRGAMDAVNYKVIHDNSSDHYPVVATFEWTSAPTTGSCRRR